MAISAGDIPVLPTRDGWAMFAQWHWCPSPLYVLPVTVEGRWMDPG